MVDENGDRSPTRGDEEKLSDDVLKKLQHCSMEGRGIPLVSNGLLT